jgi:hypothetical protein
MRFKVQYLADTSRGRHQPTARHAARGRVWVDICRPVRRLVVAEQIMLKAKIDFRDTLLRIREIAA